MVPWIPEFRYSEWLRLDALGSTNLPYLSTYQRIGLRWMKAHRNSFRLHTHKLSPWRDAYVTLWWQGFSLQTKTKYSFIFRRACQKKSVFSQQPRDGYGQVPFGTVMQWLWRREPAWLMRKIDVANYTTQLRTHQIIFIQLFIFSWFHWCVTTKKNQKKRSIFPLQATCSLSQKFEKGYPKEDFFWAPTSPYGV